MATASTSRTCTKGSSRSGCGCDVLRQAERADKFFAQHSSKKKPGPCGPGCSLADRVGNHLPEGNSWLHRDRHLGGKAIVCLQRNSSMCLIAEANNAGGRMSAMHESASTSQKFHCCAFATRKSRKTCMRATDLSSSG